ncbi:MAG: histidine kinase dimerization/phospho-acceptor domain-containing protein [Cyclobacteriaceae bacterium]|nr:histidine kinase dimerization/phospho-acceptor domain-containing protein [Cyclobacteriaceae bacterium]
MASLGELTAGIAHEIQNPLNFVNNFSEVSQELIEELKGERLKVKAERDESLESEIFVNDVYPKSAKNPSSRPAAAHCEKNAGAQPH